MPHKIRSLGAAICITLIGTGLAVANPRHEAADPNHEIDTANCGRGAYEAVVSWTDSTDPKNVPTLIIGQLNRPQSALRVQLNQR